MGVCCLAITNNVLAQKTYIRPPAAQSTSCSMQSQSAFREEFTPEVGRNGSMIVANPIGHDLPFATSTTANTSANLGPSKVGTLKKQHSFIKQEDVPRKSSRRSMRAVGAKGIAGTPDDDFNNVFRIPIPTNANPTEVLANRFQGLSRSSTGLSDRD